MKVLLVSPYSEKLVGGINNWTKYIINYHRENGGDVNLTLLNNENATQVFGTTNPVNRLFTGLSNYLPIVRHFKEKVANEHYDVAHICTSGSFGLIRDLLIVKAAKKKGVKTVVHTHFGRIPQVLSSRGWETFLLKRLLKRVDCVAVMDKSSLTALKDAGFENVRFIPNPLSDKVQKVIDDVGTIQRESNKIVFAGHILETKGVKELVEACRDLFQIKLELLGKISSDSFKEQLYQIGGKGSKDWLSIPGNKHFDEVIKEMKSCAVFALPSYSEGFPNVILEAMACGAPIVATPVGAIPEMLNVDGENPCGICVPVKNVGALQKAISDLIDNPDEASNMGKNGQLRVHEMYTISEVWRQLVGIWKTV